MGWNTDHMGWWPMVWGWVFLALIVFGIVVLAVVLVRIVGARPQQPDARGLDRSRAREVLDERYARGEIDTTEYDERSQRLDNGI